MTTGPRTAALLRIESWEPPRASSRPRLVPLTPMQRAVLESLCEGKSNRQIGVDHGITEDTVKTHMRNLMRALGARDRAHAVALAYNGEVDVKPTDSAGRVPWRHRL